jgi:PKD repeat protein
MPTENERNQGEVRMSKSTQRTLKWALAGAMLGAAAPAAAQTVLVVPYAQQNPALPHPAHSGAPITLKAIVRDLPVNCNTYNVAWDVNQNQNYNDDASVNYGRTGTTLWDIGKPFTVPVVNRNQRMFVGVRVRNTCTNADVFGSFPLYVYSFQPSGDPRQWNQTQIDVLGSMAIQESLWWMHRQTWFFNGDQGATNAAISARYGQSYMSMNGPGMWAFTINGHLPAFPPGSVNAFNRPLPNGWQAANDARWRNDPYAETVMRWSNDLTRQAAVWGEIDPAEESLPAGYAANGGVLQPARIAGTADRRGWRLAWEDSESYAQGMQLGGYATTLSALGGVPVQTGAAAGNNYEWLVQQVVDFVGAIQIDGGTGIGGWYYHYINGGADCVYNDGSTTQWALVGLESAEVAGRPFGVIVNNRHKYRVAESLIRMIGADGSAGYRCGYTDNFQLTGGAILGSRWLGMHQFDVNDGTVPFPNEAPGRTKGALRGIFNRYLDFTQRMWRSTTLRAHGGGWETRLWRNGNAYCDNYNAVYNTNDNAAIRCGNTYAMYSHQKGYRTGANTQVIQLPNEPGYDWYRDFLIYYIRAMDRGVGNYATFGRVIDNFCDAHSVTCSYGAPYMSAAAGGLIITPTLFNPKPVGVARVNNDITATVVEGCAGGNNGRVTFTHNESFHPNPSASILAYQWDVDASNGLWWVTGAAPDYQSADGQAAFTYTYPRAGNYTATLRVVDNGVGPSQQTDIQTVTVTVQAGANVAPNAAAGGPYIVEVGQALTLAGTASDSNVLCGQALSAAWDLNNAGSYNIAATLPANPANANLAVGGTIPWASLQNLPRAPQTIPVCLRVRDNVSPEARNCTTITIYPTNPVAIGTATPNPAACQQDVTFNGANSYHPNPNFIIATWQWDVDGNGTYDGGGATPTFTYRYAAFGTYNVTLRVTDSGGRQATVSFQVQVNQGNQPPVARTSQANYTVLEGDNLQLDGVGSTDANVACGDSIAAFEWDINGDGDFADAGIDTTGNRPVVPWAVLNNLRKFADPITGLPNNTITLRVRDTFGATSTVNATITIYQASPIATVVQSPNPAPINLVTGFSNPTLNGQESRSPIPGVTIASYDWDLDDNGNFEIVGRPAVEFIKVFNPVPQPNAIPQVFVRMRVTDSQGRQSSVRYQVIYRVPPTPPTADADPTSPPERNYHILLGQGVTFDPRQSFDPDTRDFGDYIRTYRWDINANVNNPVFDRTINDANGQQQNVLLTLTANELAALGVNAAGQYTILLEVEDTTNLRNRDTATLFVYAANPVAVATANPNPAACGNRVTFDGTRSDHPHPNVNIVSWAWDLNGDGNYNDAQGANVAQNFNTFTFQTPIRIGLRVTDSNGNVGTTQFDLNVNQGNRAPVASPGGPYTIVRGDALSLDGRASLDPDSACGDSIVEYAWDIRNDNTFEFSGANAAQQAVTWQQLNAAGVNNVGAYTVALRVRDRFGVTAVNTVQLNIINGPVASATAVPNSVPCNADVLFDGRASRTDAPANDASLAIVAWEWDFDNNGTYETSGQTVTRPVSGLGASVTVGFRVRDAAGHTSTSQVVVQLNVQNVAPIANAGGPYVTGPIGGGNFAAVTLDGRNSTDPNQPCDQLVSYKWDTDGDNLFGAADVNGANGRVGSDYEGATVANYRNPQWVVNNQYIVSLIVCDSKNPQLCSQPTQSVIRVLAEAPPVGEITSPRASDVNFCAGANPFNVAFNVAHPLGAQVTVTARVGGVQVAGPQVVNTLANGNPVQGTIQINPAAVPEGLRSLELVFRSGAAAEQIVNAGGNVLFDRTAPVVTIGAQLAANACYPPNQVPAPTVNVVDAGDPNARVDQTTAANGCGQTLSVTATDRCGNVGSATRAYLLAVQPNVTINGAAEGALVASAQITWVVAGPAGCASQTSATLSRNGAAGAAYAANTVINQPGAYALTLTVTNCANVQRQVIRNFVVNGPPVADAITNGHPNVDPMLAGAYRVAEGGGLQLDASESRPPEAGDSVTGYRWDFGNNNTWDLPAGGGYSNVATAAYPTNDNGVFQNKVEVRDSLNATAQQAFQVTVTDVSPTARPGGPYTVAQGVPLTLDGTGTTAGHPVADPIVSYSWNFGDGSPVETGPAATHAQRAHTYSENGVYNVTLTVTDEDSNHVATTVVTVRDVDAVIQNIVVPNPAYEIAGMRFRVNATAGAPNDPITRAEWDFTGDGVAEIAGPWPANQEVVYEFENEGNYTVSVKLFDKDSNVVSGQALPVRRITMDELLTVAQERVNAVRAANAPNALPVLRVAGTNAFINNGHWGERHNRRGVTWQAFSSVSFDIARSQAAGGNYRNLQWAMSRTFLREINAFHDAVNVAPRDANAVNSIRKAETDYIANMSAMYNLPTFRADVSSQGNAIMARDFFGLAYEAYFYLADAADACNRFNLFAMPSAAEFPNVNLRVAAANDVNTNLVTALTELQADLQAYVAEGNPADVGPGRNAVNTALTLLTQQIMPLARQRIGLICDAGMCITDVDALRNELYLMDLVNALFTAQAQGAYVRNWQHCIMLAVKFRIELSLLRVDAVCGAFNPVAREARRQQAVGLGYVTQFRYEEALQFYVSNDIRCLVIRTYNNCLVPRVRNAMTTPPFQYPAGLCPGDVAPAQP